MPAKLFLKFIIFVLACFYPVFSLSAAENKIEIGLKVEKQLSAKVEDGYLQISSNTGAFVVVILNKENRIYQMPATFTGQARIPFSSEFNYAIFPLI